MQKYKSREEVPLKYKWDLTEFCKDIDEFNILFDKCSNMVTTLSNYVGCTIDSNRLYEFLNKNIETIALLERLLVYSYLVNDQELGISDNMNRLAKMEDLASKYYQTVSFFNPELLKLGDLEYKKLFEDNKKLCNFKFELDSIYRNKKHIIDEDKENIVTSLTNAMGDFESMSSAMLNSEHDYGTINVDGEEEKITTTNLRRLMKNSDRNIRIEVRRRFCEVLDRYGVSAAQFLNGYVKGNIEVSKIHNYSSAWDAHLFSLNIPDLAVETLRTTTEKHLDILQKYYKVFKDSIGLDKLYQYDLNLDMAKSDKEYSIEEAQELCLKALEPLGEEYVKLFKKMIDDRCIDYAQYPKKCSGGYNASSINETPRILMSYNYDLDSVSIIAHEGGHHVNYQLLNKNVPMQYRTTSTLVAEVASLTNECLLSNYLMKNGSTLDEKKAGISNILSVIISNLFGAVREGKMEQDFYKYVEDGNSITKDYMDKLTTDSLNKYYGNEVILDEHSKNSWITRSHYFNDFYLYSYAFCISVATNVASEILKGNKDMLNKYMKFLSTGSDVWPIDAFKILDVDLTKKDVYENAINYFDSLLDEFIKLEKEGE